MSNYMGILNLYICVTGFSNKKMSKLLALDLSGGRDNQNFAMDIRDSAVNWMNDIENDSRYNRWSPSLSELVRPTFPGMLRNIRRNLYNLVSLSDDFVTTTLSLRWLSCERDF